MKSTQVTVDGKRYEVQEFPAGTPNGCAAGWTAIWTNPVDSWRRQYVSSEGRLGKKILAAMTARPDALVSVPVREAAALMASVS